MCNTREIQNTELASAITQPMEGPATDALEYYLKRKRCEVKHNSGRDQLSFHKVFSDLVTLEGDEVFPVISWNFDDNDDDFPSALHDTLKPATSVLIGMKRPRSRQRGLLRSKSFKKDLSLLNSKSTSDHTLPLPIAFEPLPTKLEGAAQIFPQKPSTSAVLASYSSRSLTNHAHNMVNQYTNYMS
jgi:hypothetical protein